MTILNEVGLDPGIDHLLALEVFDDIRQAGGRVESFVSWCGGLPAPECSYNPLRYKFSWSPRGVLLNTLSPAKYYHEGQVGQTRSLHSKIFLNLLEAIISCKYDVNR